MALPNHSWKDPGRALKILCNKPQSTQAPAALPLPSPPAEVCRLQELLEAVTADWDAEQFHPNALECHPTSAHVPRGKRWGPSPPGPGPGGSYRSAVLQLTAIAAQFLRQRWVVPTVCVSRGEGQASPVKEGPAKGKGPPAWRLPRQEAAGRARRTREAASGTRLAPPPCSPTNLVGLHHRQPRGWTAAEPGPRSEQEASGPTAGSLEWGEPPR